MSMAEGVMVITGERAVLTATFAAEGVDTLSGDVAPSVTVAQ
jgi:hypothetical protein